MLRQPLILASACCCQHPLAAIVPHHIPALCLSKRASSMEKVPMLPRRKSAPGPGAVLTSCCCRCLSPSHSRTCLRRRALHTLRRTCSISKLIAGVLSLGGRRRRSYSTRDFRWFGMIRMWGVEGRVGTKKTFFDFGGIEILSDVKTPCAKFACTLYTKKNLRNLRDLGFRNSC